MAETLEPGLEIRCPCGRWHLVYTDETRPLSELSGPSKYLWMRCQDGPRFAGSWGTESRHPVRKPKAG